MIRIDFTPGDLKKIEELRTSHPHPRVRQRFEALWQKSHGLQHKMICKLVGIAPNTLRAYLRDFRSGGIEKLCEINFYRPKSELENYKTCLVAYFKKHPATSGKQISSFVERHLAIKISPKRALEFFKKAGVQTSKSRFYSSQG